MLACVRRLCNDASAKLKFNNADDTLRFEVETVAADVADKEDDLAAEVYVEIYAFAPWVSDDQGFDKVIEAVLQREFGPDYDDDTGGFSVDSVHLETVREERDVTKLMDTLNRLHRWSLCPCTRHIVFDEAPMCLLCQAMATRESSVVLEDPCIICLQDCMAMHAARTPCCDKLMHRLCARRHEQNSTKCPACRKRCRSVSASSSASD